MKKIGLFKSGLPRLTFIVCHDHYYNCSAAEANLLPLQYQKIMQHPWLIQFHLTTTFSLFESILFFATLQQLASFLKSVVLRHSGRSPNGLS